MKFEFTDAQKAHLRSAIIRYLWRQAPEAEKRVC